MSDIIPIMALPFGDELISAAKRARDTGEDQRAGMIWGCQVMVLAPDRQPPLRYPGRFTVRFNADGSIVE